VLLFSSKYSFTLGKVAESVSDAVSVDIMSLTLGCGIKLLVLSIGVLLSIGGGVSVDHPQKIHAIESYAHHNALDTSGIIPSSTLLLFAIIFNYNIK